MLAQKQSDTVTPNDDILLRRAGQGDKQAVTLIYQAYFEPIYQFIRLRVADSQTAEDLCSIVFTKFINALKTGKGPRNHLRGWLYKVARNAIHDHYGAAAQIQTETLDEWFRGSPDDEPEAQVLHLLDIEQLREALQSLSADQLDVLLLRFDQHLSVQETAEIMGKNINTIKTLQLRALDKLRRIVQQQITGGR